jgi:hypothetical protein
MPTTTIQGLALKPDSSCGLTDYSGETYEAQLLGSSIVSPWFVLLHLRTDKKTRHVLICRDSLEPDTFRQLRVALHVIKLGDGTLETQA